jgi:branched-chain amino acid transport system substrate-binding protein
MNFYVQFLKKSCFIYLLVTWCLTNFPALVCADDLRIGATLALSGAYSTYGRQALQGIQLAVEDVNADGGVNGRKVKLIVEDEGTLDLRAALTAARKLVDVDKVDVLLPLIIEDSEVIIPFTSQKPLFTMAVGCGARKCGFNVGPYHVRAPSSHDSIIETLMAYVRMQKVRRTCIVAAESTYFEAYGRYIEELSKASNYEVTYVGVPLSNFEDYRDVATKFKSTKCEVVFSWLPMGSVGSFFRRVRESGSKALLVGIVESDDPGVLKAAGQAANGVVFARFSLGSQDFLRRYIARFNEEPSRPALPSYDGVKLLLELIKKVGTDPNKLKEAFVQVKDRPAENGTITYTSEGERIGETVQLMQIVEGRPVELNIGGDHH